MLREKGINTTGEQPGKLDELAALLLALFSHFWRIRQWPEFTRTWKQLETEFEAQDQEPNS